MKLRRVPQRARDRWRKVWGLAATAHRQVRRPGALVQWLARGRALWAEGGIRSVVGKARHFRRRLGVELEYAQWVAAYDTISAPDRTALSQRVAGIESPPRISVVMPVFAAEVGWVAQAVSSVREQIYPHWELCVTDDASPNPEVRELLRQVSAEDLRIKVCFRSENGHISVASNDALQMATGDFVALLDHDDLLPAHALLLVAETAARNSADIFYSDEDKIDEQGRRFNAYFKPDWSPELFWAQNVVSHLGVYRTALVRQVGGFRPGFEGSQDYDLALRVVEQSGPSRIIHIPHVLYHWRAISGSTALRIDEKSYAYDAARRAVAEHLDRRGISARVEPAPGLPTWHRIVHPLPDPAPRVSILIPSRDNLACLRRCVASVRARTTYAPYAVCVIDNGSRRPDTRAYLEQLAGWDGFTVLEWDRPFNYSAMHNWAAAQVDGDLLCLLNDDVEVISSDWLRELVSHAVRPDVGAVGAMLYYPDDTIQHAGVILGLGGIGSHAHRHVPRGAPGYFGRARLTQQFSAVTAAGLVVRREVFAKVGGFDEQLVVAYNDVDFCLRLSRAGYRNIWTPYAELYHWEAQSRGSDGVGARRADFLAEAERMRSTWAPLINQDPFFNPNLSLDWPDFRMAFPPRGDRWTGPGRG